MFLPYVRDYVDTFIGKSITTSQWRTHLYDYFERTDRSKIIALDTINWNVSPLKY